jgi:hypothetical protein
LTTNIAAYAALAGFLRDCFFHLAREFADVINLYCFLIESADELAVVISSFEWQCDSIKTADVGVWSSDDNHGTVLASGI